MAEGEDGVVTKRRLPSWMSATNAPDKKMKTKALPSPVKRGGGTRRKMVTNKFRRSPPPDDDPLSSEDEEDSFSSHQTSAADKRVAPSSKHNKKQQQQLKSQEATDTDDLTVDDLIAIAQEYAKADDEEECPRGATIEPESGKGIAATLFSCRNKTGGSTLSNEVLPTHTSLGFVSTLSNLDQTKLMDQENSTSEDFIQGSSRMGDPAEDMLDLLLGPLLKKPQIEPTMHEAVLDEIPLDNRFQERRQKEEFGTQVFPLMKKKSSLKDKVAMFLD